MNKLILATLLAISTLSFASDKIYIDEENFKSNGDAFYIHQGGNVWIHTDTVHRDSSGLYTFDSHIVRSMRCKAVGGYEKKWRCPYCYSYWPVGTKCQNADCPSKYNM